MTVTRQFLFIGGPLHTRYLPVPQNIAVPEVGAPANDVDTYPNVWTSIAHATNYVRRSVQHIDGHDGTTYMLSVFVHEDIHDADTAQLRLGEAVAHRYFVEHGSVVAVASSQPQHTLIVPGR